MVFTIHQHWSVGISGWYFCTVSFGGNTFGRFCGNSFLNNSVRIPFFLKRGAKCTKKGPKPPFLGKRGLPPNYWYRNVYRENTNWYQPKIPNRYNCNKHLLDPWLVERCKINIFVKRAHNNSKNLNLSNKFCHLHPYCKLIFKRT